MTSEKGHFEQGRWVVEPEAPAQQSNGNVIDKRLSDATKSVITSLDDMVKVTHDLITTEEGKQYIDKTMKDMQAELQKSFDQIISRAKAEFEKTKKSGK
jgi:heme oxygenase